jgi:hypothetical protein
MFEAMPRMNVRFPVGPSGVPQETRRRLKIMRTLPINVLRFVVGLRSSPRRPVDVW